MTVDASQRVEPVTVVVHLAIRPKDFDTESIDRLKIALATFALTEKSPHDTLSIPGTTNGKLGSVVVIAGTTSDRHTATTISNRLIKHHVHGVLALTHF